MDLVSQNLLLTSGGKKDSTYVDDVFSHVSYIQETIKQLETITNGIDNLGEGGLVWTKRRSGSGAKVILLYDTVRASGSNTSYHIILIKLMRR